MLCNFLILPDHVKSLMLYTWLSIVFLYFLERKFFSEIFNHQMFYWNMIFSLPTDNGTFIFLLWLHELLALNGTILILNAFFCL